MVVTIWRNASETNKRKKQNTNLYAPHKFFSYFCTSKFLTKTHHEKRTVYGIYFLKALPDAKFELGWKFAYFSKNFPFIVHKQKENNRSVHPAALGCSVLEALKE